MYLLQHRSFFDRIVFVVVLLLIFIPARERETHTAVVNDTSRREGVDDEKTHTHAREHAKHAEQGFVMHARTCS